MKVQFNFKNNQIAYNSLVLILLIFVFIAVSFAIKVIPDKSENSSQPIELNEGWQYRWQDAALSGDHIPDWNFEDFSDNAWAAYSIKGERLKTTASNIAWFRVKLPDISKMENPTIYFDAVLSDSVEVYYQNQLIHRSTISEQAVIKNFSQAVDRFVAPIGTVDSNGVLVIRVTSHSGIIGPRSTVKIGSNDLIIKELFRRDVESILLGFFFVIFGLFLVPNFVFLKKEDLKTLLYLSSFVISIGTWLLTSSYNFNFWFVDNNKLRLFINALSVYICMFSILFFINRIFPIKGKKFKMLWKANLIALGVLLVLHSCSYLLFESYIFIFETLWQALAALSFIMLASIVYKNTASGNLDAKMFTIGFILFLLICTYELVMYLTLNIIPTMYKWGILIFIASLVLIMGRRFSETHEKLLKYSNELQHKNATLNKTLQELQEYKKEIEDLNASLEKRVNERTLELKNALEDLVRTQQQLIESEKMAALGGLVAGVAHEINTPVGIGVTAASHMTKEIDHIEEIYKSNTMKKNNFEEFINICKELNDVMLTNLRNASNLIKSFKKVSVDQINEEHREFNVKEYLNEIITSLTPEIKKTKHTIEIDCPDNFNIVSYAGAFSQIITNLIINALTHAFPNIEHGIIRIEIKGLNDMFYMRFSDNGVGIEGKNLKHIFEPFFTTKRNNGGTGLGLNIVYNIVTHKFKGRISCQSESGRGALFLIEFPIKNQQ